MRINQESPAEPMKKKAHNICICPLPPWGQIKQLAAEREELIHHTSQSFTPEALLLAMVAILSCQVRGTLGETYWAYVPDPSLFTLCLGMIPESRYLPTTLLFWGAQTPVTSSISGPF
jgi:hypothetical protein